MNLSLLESGILGVGIRNPALGILNPAIDWNPESRSLKIYCRWYYPTKLEAIDSLEGKIIEGNPLKGRDLNGRHDNGILKQ